MTLTRTNHTNLERRHDFDVSWHEPTTGMFTAVLRVKNESQSLPFVLPGLFRVADALILVDNGSDDGTPEISQRVAEEQGAADRFKVLDYPFQVSRCGSEHLATPPN